MQRSVKTQDSRVVSDAKVADLSRRSVGLVCGPAVLEVSACWGTRVKGGIESRTKVAFSHRSSHAVDRRHDI